MGSSARALDVKANLRVSSMRSVPLSAGCEVAAAQNNANHRAHLKICSVSAEQTIVG